MNTTRKLTFASICSALIVVLLFLGAFVQTGTLAVYFLCTLLMMVIVTETDKFYGLLAYIATGLLVYFLLPDKNMAIAYIALYGIYGVIKSLAEKIRQPVLSWAVKIAFFNFAITLGYSIVTLFSGSITAKLPLWALWLAGNILLIIYDVLLSFGIDYYYKYIQKKMRKL